MRYLLFNLLLALTARGAQPVPRGLSGPGLVDRFLDVRQLPSATSSPIGLPTQLPTSTDGVESNPPAPTSSVVVSLTTNPVATSDPGLITSDVLATTSIAPTTAVQTAPVTTSSVPLLFTQTSTSTRPSSSATSTATSAPVTDINIPFSQSKYHQMIIALGCFAVGLLIAFIVTVIIALRARADVDLLKDRLNRYEEGLLMDQQPKEGSAYNIGYGASRSFGQRSYGRVSTNDPDGETGARPRRSTGDGQFASLASTASGKGETAKGSRPQPGPRRVTFSEDDHSIDASPPLSTTTSRDPAPQYSQTRPLALAPKSTNRDPYGSSALVQSPPQLTSSPPQSNFTSAPFAPSSVHPSSLQPRMSDPGRVGTPPIRRLPVAPGASVSSHEGPGYKDPFATSHGRSASGGYPPY